LIKIIFILFLYISLTARENPFFNTNEANMPITSNQKIVLDPLKRVSLSLPSTAREIESITVKYKNLDGSISTKELKLNNTVDWHIPLFISQAYAPLKERATTLKKAVRKDTQFKKLYTLAFISFYQSNTTLKVVAKAAMIRNFLLVHPHRIVFDMKQDLSVRSYIKKLRKNKIFTKIRIGNHKGYYRVVVELDGYYAYTLHKNKNSYIFNLH